MSRPIDLTTKPSIHVIGCGGTGMAPITAVLAHLGLNVSGSDQRPSATLDALSDLGVRVTVGAGYDVIDDEAVLVRSTAVPDDHPEVAAALLTGRPVHRRADVLAAITDIHRTVAVAGTHGKTTTSSMVTAALAGAGVDISSIVGGRILGLDQPVPGAVLGEPGGVLVVEADESDATCVELVAEVAVVTNIEPDHLEHYGGEAGLLSAFDTFLTNDGLRAAVVCADDPGVGAALDRTQADRSRLVTYGQVAGCDVGLHFDPPAATVRIDGFERRLEPRLPGLHNALNLTAALAVAAALDLDLESAAAALDRFEGVGRRFERRGVSGGVQVVDDYAHLRGEIVAAIAAAREVCDGRIHVAFQPHRYSRTEALWHTYADALLTADSVVLTDIYASGEDRRAGITSDLIFDDLVGRHPRTALVRVGTPDEVPAALAELAQSGDLCLLLSAGDLPSIAEPLLDALRTTP